MKTYISILPSLLLAVILSSCSGDIKEILKDTLSKSESSSTEPKSNEPDNQDVQTGKKAPEPKAPTNDPKKHPDTSPKTPKTDEPDASNLRVTTSAPNISGSAQVVSDGGQGSITRKSTQKMYIFGHSLIKHDYHENAYGTDRTSVPYWMAQLTKSSGLNFSLSGKYGFLRDHLDYVIPQWGFKSRDVNMAWNEEDGTSFSAASFNSIMITPANFIQYQAPSEPYYDSSDTPISATLNIIDWVSQRSKDPTFYIYENWPDMGDPFPPSDAKFIEYHEKTAGEVHRWWLEYYSALVNARPNSEIKIIPVGSVIANTLLKAPYSNIGLDDLYEDSAPHGRPTIYFLAAMITYSAIYGEKVPRTYRPASPVHPIVIDNYAQLRNDIWNALNNFNQGNKVW